MTAVTLKNVSKVFPGETLAVDSLNMEVNHGEFLVLLGPSGCGKSTVLRMVAGLEAPSEGEIMLDGEYANDLPPRERNAAMIFQTFALYPHMSVGENIGFPLKLGKKNGGQSVPEAVGDMAGALGISDLLERKPGQLSGGQQQRVAMGRALVRRPKLFLMDEPLSNLDIGLRAELRTEISSLVRRHDATTLYVTHDQTEALTMADRVAVLRKGVLQDVGTPDEIYERPATMYVAAFLGTPRMNLLEARVNVYLDRYVALDFGDQELRLPWHDLRGRAVARYHGENIVVGMRAEALAPVAEGQPGQSLQGRVRFYEHHGHETLVFLDIGATAIVPDGIGDKPDLARNGSKPRRRLTGLFSGFGAGSSERRPDEDTGPIRKPADLVFRLPPHIPISAGQPITVAVHMDALHYFDKFGKRIDVGWSQRA
ncbi:ABC transporter ATP-binding protein [Glycomyces arizonensis]|uniref:ABC transporter ATP-binding protein n=1 Tax=Glycomyces arizonensis TaxID=256035 RepID=UPI0003F716E2|nr:ABC transporter ATP-binding protein [Glycomyces arizonensis]